MKISQSFLLLLLSKVFGFSAAFSLEMMNAGGSSAAESRRGFLKTVGLATAAMAPVSVFSGMAANAATPEIKNTPGGIKYAVLKMPSKGGSYPQNGDIVAIEYVGYLVDGSIFDATHGEGKSNALVWKLGSGSVIPAFDEIVREMVVGQKVQAIVPPQLAYGDKGVCLDDGECLIKPGSTLVYDIYFKKSAIPPP